MAQRSETRCIRVALVVGSAPRLWCTPVLRVFASTGHRAAMARARAAGRSGVAAGPRGSRPGVLHGRSSQAISTGAEMPGGENRREVRCLGMLAADAEVVATWAGVVRMVALHRPVQVLLDGCPDERSYPRNLAHPRRDVPLPHGRAHPVRGHIRLPPASVGPVHLGAARSL